MPEFSSCLLLYLVDYGGVHSVVSADRMNLELTYTASGGGLVDNPSVYPSGSGLCHIKLQGVCNASGWVAALCETHVSSATTRYLPSRSFHENEA